MPIMTGDFVHFGHQETVFPSIRREPHKNWMRIKAGRTEFSAYAIDNVPGDLEDMMVYMRSIMELSIEDENIAKKKKEAAKLKQPKQKPMKKKWEKIEGEEMGGWFRRMLNTFVRKKLY